MLLRLVLPLLVLLAPAPALAGGSHGDLRIYSKKGAAFADVAADIEDAIVNRGYVIDHKGFIGDMLARTGPDTGAGGSPYVDARYFSFCSAALSGRMMNADPRNIGYCPYVVFVYELKSAPGTVHAGYRKLHEAGPDASEKAIEAINAMLDGLVREAAE